MPDGVDGLLPLLLSGAAHSTSCSSTSSLPANFAAALQDLVGERIKVFFTEGPYTLLGVPRPYLVTACLEQVGSDFVVLTRIAIDGTPVVDPRRLVVPARKIGEIQRLTPEEELLELLTQQC